MNETKIKDIKKDIRESDEIAKKLEKLVSTPTEELVARGISIKMLLDLDDPALGKDPNKLTDQQKREVIERTKERWSDAISRLRKHINTQAVTLANLPEPQA